MAALDLVGTFAAVISMLVYKAPVQVDVLQKIANYLVRAVQVAMMFLSDAA